MAKERELDIFMLLEQLDRKNYGLWESLSPEQQKEFSPLVTLRWMSGCNDDFQCIMLNEVVNVAVFNIAEMRSLLMRLLTVCSSGTRKRYKWINFKTTQQKQSKLGIQLIMNEYQLSRAEAIDTIRLFSPAELISLAEDAGWQKDEIKNLQKELK